MRRPHCEKEERYRVREIKSNVVLLQYGLSPFTLNPFQFNLEFGTTHQVQMCYTSKQV